MIHDKAHPPSLHWDDSVQRWELWDDQPVNAGDLIIHVTRREPPDLMERLRLGLPIERNKVSARMEPPPQWVNPDAFDPARYIQLDDDLAELPPPTGQRYVSPEAATGKTVTWAGSSRDYWANAEVIHRYLTAEFVGVTDAETAQNDE